MEWEKSPRWLPSQNPRRQPRALPFPPAPHFWLISSLNLSGLFSLLYSHCFRVLSSVFLPRTITAAYSLVSALVSSPSNQPPWCLQKSKCSCLNPSVAPLTTQKAQTSGKPSKISTNWLLSLRVMFQRHTLYFSHAEQLESFIKGCSCCHLFKIIFCFLTPSRPISSE